MALHLGSSPEGSASTNTGAAARLMADELAEEPHPIWGHRAWQIIRSLTSGAT